MRISKPKLWRRKLGRTYSKRLRKALFVILSAECIYGLCVLGDILQKEQQYHVEWLVPAADQEEQSSDIYGIWFNWQDWEVQFYHSNQSIKGH